jgi:hypothetical protein
MGKMMPQHLAPDNLLSVGFCLLSDSPQSECKISVQNRRQKAQ